MLGSPSVPDLLAYASLGDVSALSEMLTNGMSVNSLLPQTGMTPLSCAAQRGQFEAVQV
jgi:hypothetical protein